MTREEAIRILKECKERKLKYTFYTLDEYQAATDMAIKALEQEPCEDCEDAVNRGLYEQTRWERDIAVKQLSDLGYQLGEKVRKSEDAISRQAVKQEFAEWHKGGYEDCAFYKYLDKMPPVSVAEKVGKWELVYRDCGIEYYLCSKCHEGKVAIDGDYYKSITEFMYCPNCGCRMVEPQESEVEDGKIE